MTQKTHGQFTWVAFVKVVMLCILECLLQGRFLGNLPWALAHGERMPDYLPLEHTEFKAVFEALKTLPQFRECCCPHCETTFSYATIVVYATCPSCGTQIKTRCFGGYEEIQNLILLVLDWLGSQETRTTLLKEFDRFEERGHLTNWDDFFDDD